MDPKAVMPSSALNFSALVLAMAVIFSLSGHGAPAVIQSLIQVTCIASSLPGSLGAWLPIPRTIESISLSPPFRVLAGARMSRPPLIVYPSFPSQARHFSWN